MDGWMDGTVILTVNSICHDVTLTLTLSLTSLNGKITSAGVKDLYNSILLYNNTVITTVVITARTLIVSRDKQRIAVVESALSDRSTSMRIVRREVSHCLLPAQTNKVLFVYTMKLARQSKLTTGLVQLAS